MAGGESLVESIEARVIRLEERVSTFEEALASQRSGMKTTIQQLTEAVKALKEQMNESQEAWRTQASESQDAIRKLAQRFEASTREMNAQNVEALREVVATMIGNRVMAGVAKGAQYLIWTAIMGGLGYMWYHIILGKPVP